MKHYGLLKMSLFYKILLNFLFVGLLFLTLKVTTKKFQAYTWMWDTLLHKNYSYIGQNPNLTFEQKQEMKLGFYAKYLNHVKNNTEEDAIILMPPDSTLSSTEPQLNLKYLKDRRRTTYFLYPRKPVYRKSYQYDKNLLAQLTHVAIVDYQGYQELGYKLRDKHRFTVLPITNK